MTSMAQAKDVIASGGWWSAAEVADKLALGGYASDGNGVRQALNSLVAKGLVERRKRGVSHQTEQWEYRSL